MQGNMPPGKTRVQNPGQSALFGVSRGRKRSSSVCPTDHSAHQRNLYQKCVVMWNSEPAFDANLLGLLGALDMAETV